MGYETKMYVVERHGSNTGKICLANGDVHSCYLDKNLKETGRPTYHYYPDHNTETPVPSTAPIKDGTFCQVIGMLDLCKADQWPVCSFEESDGCYIFDSDGNSLVGMDPYGSYRSFVPIDEVIKRLQEEIKKDSYRRFRVALAMLVSIRANFSDDLSNIGCLFYGH